MVAALFVRSNTPYKALGCDCYDIHRDALTWRGGQPGVFHPPCRSWGRLAHVAKPRPGERELAHWAIRMCRENGGVLEHPDGSRLWQEAGCSTPGVRDQWGGVLVFVRQQWWGHRAQKKTGLYIVGPVPEIPFDIPRPGVAVENMCRAEREATPPAFARFLVDIARACA